jgi:hypothetical protein
LIEERGETKLSQSTKFLVEASIKNCGIATVIINALINYFTFVKPDGAAGISSTVAIPAFMAVVIGCALICPLFGGLILKGLKTDGVSFGTKDSHALGKFVPNSMLPGVLVIAAFTSVLFWFIPNALIGAAGIAFALPRMAWVITIGVYSGIVAAFAAYFGIMRAYYAKQK